ncbi:MAG TPA: AMP-binding protein [Terriglobia bacterium]|nr:AMP-binding protein [Terriglobia bacterium]
MIEPLLRQHGPRLQLLYDRMPPSVRTLLTSTRGWVLTRLRYSPAMYAHIRELQSHEKWTAEEMTACQLKELQHCLDNARKFVPFYADYPAIEFRSGADLARLPLLTREVVRENASRFISTNAPKSQLIRVGTTGTTGANLKVAYTTGIAQQNWAFAMRQWLWAGIQPRAPRLTFFGSRVVPTGQTTPPYWAHNYLERQILVSIYHLSESAAPDYLTFLHRHEGKVLEGFPSVLGILADFILQREDSIPMRVVFTSGEPLYPFLREKIEKAFCARVYDCYGNTELCGLIQECERGQMHLIPEYGYLEILDEQNNPVRGEDEGYLVWTSLLNQTMPLIRYRIGDRGRWQGGEPCACGRVYPLVVPTITRESDLLTCPDGRIYSPRSINQLLKETSAFRFCQFVQDERDRVVIRAVASNGRASEELSRVQERLQKLLGKTMRVNSELAPEPIVRAGGKIPLIVQKVKS